MRKYISYIIYAVAAVFMTGCMDVAVNPIEPESPTKVILQLTNADLVATRAVTVTDDDNFNEDLIKSVQCFFTVTGGDAVVYATDLIEVNQQATKTLEIEIPADKISTMFGTTNSCDVYVLANYGTKLEETTITAVKAKEIALGTGATQDYFVMDGEAALTLNGVSISGTVSLERAAAKVVVKVNLKNSVTEGGVVWTSAPAGVKMAYKNSVNGSKISALAADAAETVADYSQQPTETSGIFTQDTDSSTETTYVGYQTTPFYSFPVSAEANDGVIELVIPWTPADGDPVEYKYQIPIDAAFERNHVYVVEVNVGMLGTLDGAVLTPSYVVVDWTENAINTSLSRPKYLVVQQHSYALNNETTIDVPFNSSDNCVVTITCTQVNLKTGATKTVTRNDNATTLTNKSYKASINNDTGIISIEHGLNNDFYDQTDDTDGIFDFTPYKFEIVVQHDGDPDFTETITVTQYPAMYGTANINSDYNNGGDVNDDNGFVWVNGYQEEPKSGVTNFGGAYGLTGDDDLNAIAMYTITTTSLPASSDYIIGDPRKTSYDNPQTWNGNQIVWATAPALYEGETNRTLKYYYPTDGHPSGTTGGVNSPTYNMIAPKFRVCSAYGAIAYDQTNRRYYENVKGRCASYQEDGYPAGRWRLPTKAEFEIINTLTNSGFLPTLFVPTMDYWCAHGYGVYDEGSGDFEIVTNRIDHGNSWYGSVSVRCVYDEWYWGSEPALTTEAQKDVFTWGDQPR